MNKGSCLIEYEGERFEEGFRADLVVEGKVIVELKSVERINPSHKKQLLTYLRLTGMKLGYLLNFGEALMKDGSREPSMESFEQISVPLWLREKNRIEPRPHTAGRMPDEPQTVGGR